MTDFRWTAEQAEAIRSEDHTLLAASAGTGKTTTVIGKILWRLGIDVGVQANGEPIPPCAPDRRVTLSQIAAITFTEKAAYDLKNKLRQEIGKCAPGLMWEIDRASIGTIHGFCGDILREHALRLGVDSTFRVLDEREARIEQDEIIKDIVLAALARNQRGVVALVQRYTFAGSTHNPGAVDYVRDVFRDLRWHPDRYQAWCQADKLTVDRLRKLCDAWSDADDVPAEYCEALFRLAVKAKAARQRFERDENVRDFDSLILDTRSALTREIAQPALASIRRRLRLLIIDEFQDTDGAQRDIAFAIAGIEGNGGSRSEARETPQLFVVGHPKQSIYRFRGADIQVWNAVKHALCGESEPLQLTHNFRSDPAVVDFVNRVCAPVMRQVGAALATEVPQSRVDYMPLQSGRAASGVGEVEWLAASAAPAAARRESEAELVAARIRDVVIDPSRGDTTGIRIVDPESGEVRDCAYRDVAILFRTRTGLDAYEAALRRYGVPYYLAGDAGLTNRLEILDLLTVLRLIDNTRDDLSAFAFFRSPFVGLRDEVIARMRLSAKGGTLLRQARNYMTGGDWFAAPEHAHLVDIERAALVTGLDVIDELSARRSRMHADQLLQEVIDRTGYRLHLAFLDQPEPKVANIDRFLRLLRGYRHHTLGTFLEVWDRWEDQGLGIPQAALYSKSDNVVTLSTIHSAKGLEWPIVFLVDVHDSFSERLTNTFVSDKLLGPIICPKKDERGPRARRIYGRANLEEQAEEARLMYVASTRARDRLIVASPLQKPKDVAEWLHRGYDDSVRTTHEPADVQIPPLPPEPELSWLDDLREGGQEPHLAPALPAPPIRRTRSATELMTWRKSRKEWALKFVHGVIPAWRFARESRDSVPADVRGVVIHEVLERIQEEAELAELLEVTIGGLDSPEMEERMAAGTEYRAALEDEIRSVIQSEEWAWYVDGEHYRELSFVHLRTDGKWRVGAFDLYRPGTERLIVDFKTHDITVNQAASTAAKYRLQAGFYRTVVRSLSGEAKVCLHFTRPNQAVRM